MDFQARFKGDYKRGSRVFHGSVNKVSTVNSVSRKFHENLKGIRRVF